MWSRFGCAPSHPCELLWDFHARQRLAMFCARPCGGCESRAWPITARERPHIESCCWGSSTGSVQVELVKFVSRNESEFRRRPRYKQIRASATMRLLSLSVSQLLWVFIASKILTKIKNNRLFLRWISSYGLEIYQVPTDDELRRLQCPKRQETRESKSKNKKKGARSSPSSEDRDLLQPNEFKIRCSDLVKLNLNKSIVSMNMLNSAPLSSDLEWIPDFALVSLISFLLTQTLFHFNPQSNYEYNFSLIWIYLVIVQSSTILTQISSIYFTSKSAVGERAILIVSAIFFFMLAILVMIFGESHLELNLEKSLHLLSEMIFEKDLHDISLPSSGKAFGHLANTCIKFTIAMWCAFVGAIFTFPGFRFGQMHESLLVAPTTSTIQKVMYNLVNLVSPCLIICLWMPKISRNILIKQEYLPIDDETFDLIRICILVSTNVLRLILVRRYIQAFLLGSVETKLAQVKRMGGIAISKRIQILISNLNNFVNLACIQYVIPTLMCLFTSIMFASLTYCSDVGDELPTRFSSLRYLFSTANQQALLEEAEEIIHETRRLFCSDLLKNFVGFNVWWLHFAWLCTSALGVGYHKYILH
jgi:hypothetical protein